MSSDARSSTASRDVGDAPVSTASGASSESSTAGSPGRSYNQILKSSAVIGGSSVINIGVSIVRAKAMALMLGPAGVGLLGLFAAVLDLAVSVSGMGLNGSGVRQIAEAVGSGDQRRVATTAVVLRRTAMVLGAIGAAILIVLRAPISRWTFGTDQFAFAVALLGVAVFARAISDGQKALIQGVRRIGDLARIEIAAALVGTTVTLGLIYQFREAAIVPSLIVTALVTLAAAWWYRRKIPIEPVAVTVPRVRHEASALLQLGLAFMVTAVLTSAAAYAIRTLLANGISLEAAGLYQAAWSIGGLYVGFILQAMGTDFYPRLTAVAHRHDECNRMVNEQAQVSLLLAAPGIVGTMTFAPLVIALFYAGSFAAAATPLRWICLGMGLRIISWPMGYILLAKGARNTIVGVEVAAAIVHVGLAALLARWFGLAGATIAFAGLYVWHAIVTYVIVRRLTGFRWAPETGRFGTLFLASLAVVFGGFAVLPGWAATGLGGLMTAASAIYSLRSICRLVALDRVPRAVRAALAWSRLIPSPDPQLALGARPVR
jgi:antigen flippase